MQFLFYLILAAVLLVGLYINLVNMPGNWVMVLATLVYGFVTHWAYTGFKMAVTIFALALAAEGAELLVAGRSAKKAGASRRGLWGAIIGGLAGGFCLTALVPVPVLGTIVGVCLGTFLGAIIGELWGGTKVHHSLWIGTAAAWGRLLGILTKLLFACVILAIVLWTAFPWGARRNPASPANKPPGRSAPAGSPSSKVSPGAVRML